MNRLNGCAAEMADVIIEQLTEATPEAAKQLESLLEQLTQHAQPLDVKRLQQIIDGSGAVYVARGDGKIVGSVTRLDLRHPVRTRCWIDDLVVDSQWRGQGIAQKLMERAIADAPQDAVSVRLSSKVSRVDSHRLYSKLGFEVREDSRMWTLKL
jgi:ribosomal protein S18 acetylase RimI-like enzyme